MSAVRRSAVAATERLDPATAQFAADVEWSLTQTPRQLPCRYFYDGLGSALFEAICRLPWYRVTRAEERLLLRYGRDVLRQAAPLSTIVELGSGSGEKVALLVGHGRVDARPIDIHLVDISASALDASVRTLAGLDGVRVTPHRASYEDGLRGVVRHPLGDGRRLVLFLGSNIGNFDRPSAVAFARAIRQQLRHGDGLLLGVDLVKPERELLLAYDDPLGVTAAFDLNLLARINGELGGNFDLRAFAHRAVWNARESRVEMHLVSRAEQLVRIDLAGLEFTMSEGEPIWTESSYKYEPGTIVELLEAAAFHPLGQWVDPVDRFALTLVEAG